MIRERKKETKTDTVLLILVLLLAVFGLVMLFSISEYNGRVRFGDSAYYFKKQLFATALGLMTMYIVAETDYRFFVRLAPAAYLLSMGLSTAVLFVGQEINGSRRWLNFGPLSFQPSEFAKAAVILFLTWQIQGSKKTTAGFWFMCRTMLTLLPIVGLVGSNNLSTAIIILGIGVILIFISDPGYARFIGMGVTGAALATVTSNIIVSLCFIYLIIKNKEDYFKIKLFRDVEFSYYKTLFVLGTPVALQNGLFTVFSMIMGVIVASFGPVAIAVQKVGSQIESISWNSCDGFASALSSFVGQNYGAKKIDRINKSTRYALIGVILWGSLTTVILVFLGEPIFRAFINEPEAILKGTDYLKILGYSQLFMCLEITVSGIFKGLGRTYIPSIIIAVLTGMRIPMAILLSKPEILGLNGIWWSITISSIIKGILLFIILVVLRKIHKLYKTENL